MLKYLLNRQHICQKHFGAIVFSAKVSWWNDFNADLTVYCFYLQELMELEARRERVRLNVARMYY